MSLRRIMDSTLDAGTNSSAALLLCATLLVSLHLWRWLRYRAVPGPPAPPGPPAWPLVGNAPQLGNAPHLYFMRMAQKFGNVFRIKLGSRTVVVLNGDSIKQALVQQGPDFAGRPDFTSFRVVGGGDSLAFGTVSAWWKAHRKVAQTTVRMFSTGNADTKRALEQHVLCEVREMLKRFVEETVQRGHFQPMSYLVVSTANIMSAVCFGKRYSYEDAEFQQVVGRNEQFTKTVGAGSIVDVMPWLQFFPNPIKTVFDNFKDLNLDFNRFIRDKVLQHRKDIQSGVIRDMTDAFIVAMDRLRDESGASSGKDYVPAAVGDVFGASQDTLSTALQWIVLILVKFPDMQQRLQVEVDRVVDRSRLPSLQDQIQLPYVMAFVYEVLRFTSFLPLTIPHSTTTDTSIAGYAIPKDTVVFINQWSINHDPERWPRPETFDPTRFLDGNGDLNKDLAASVLIFSLGKRRCIGEQLSKLQLFLFTALLAHQVHITKDPAANLTMDYDYGLTLKPKAYSIAVRLRDHMRLLDQQAG